MSTETSPQHTVSPERVQSIETRAKELLMQKYMRSLNTTDISDEAMCFYTKIVEDRITNDEKTRSWYLPFAACSIRADELTAVEDIEDTRARVAEWKNWFAQESARLGQSPVGEELYHGLPIDRLTLLALNHMQGTEYAIPPDVADMLLAEAHVHAMVAYDIDNLGV